MDMVVEYRLLRVKEEKQREERDRWCQDQSGTLFAEVDKNERMGMFWK